MAVLGDNNKLKIVKQMVNNLYLEYKKKKKNVFCFLVVMDIGGRIPNNFIHGC